LPRRLAARSLTLAAPCATSPGRRTACPHWLASQSLVLLLGVTACVMLATTVPSLAWIAGALVLSGFMASGVMLTLNLSLREALPQSAHAAGFSVM
jgi:hypothetical protein